MAEIAREDVEILVHTTAPSRGPDDARYRALAQAYLDFQPAARRRLDIEPRSSIGNILDTEAENQLQDEPCHSTQDERESRASYRPDEDEIASESSSQHLSSNKFSISNSLGSPQLSFHGVLDNFDSPAFRARTPHYECAPRTPSERKHTQSPARSWKTPPSTIADSQPDYERNLVAFSSPTTVLGLCLQSRTRFDNSSPAQSLELVEETILDVQSSGELARSDTSRDLGAQSSPSPQNKSQSKPLVTRADEVEIIYMQNIIPTLKREEPCSSAGYPSSPSLVPTDATLPGFRNLPPGYASLPAVLPRKRAARSSQKSPERVTSPPKRQRIEPSSSQAAALTKSTKPNMSTTPSMVSAGPSFWADVFEIRPTPPLTSTADLTGDMLITNPLRQLVKKIKSSQCLYPFIPKEQTRELRPMERGYWQVNCEKWDTSMRDRCWDFLGKYVGRDSAGWGVSCIRDAETRGLRVYCWGIVAEHIYLLLHMASASKIKGTGACWVGGDGSPIIIMPSS